MSDEVEEQTYYKKHNLGAFVQSREAFLELLQERILQEENNREKQLFLINILKSCKSYGQEQKRIEKPKKTQIKILPSKKKYKPEVVKREKKKPTVDKKEYNKRYIEKNREYINQKNREYYRINKKKLNETKYMKRKKELEEMKKSGDPELLKKVEEERLRKNQYYKEYYARKAKNKDSVYL